MLAVWNFQHHCFSSRKHRVFCDAVELRTECGWFSCSNGNLSLGLRRLAPKNKFLIKAIDSVSSDSDQGARDDEVAIGRETDAVNSKFPDGKQQEWISTFAPLGFLGKGITRSNFAVGICVVSAFLVIVMGAYLSRKSRKSRPGSVADLVRRGQLRSDRRGITRPLKYDDPFNNPLIKVGKSNSTIEICGKIYRLAPVTLTEEQRAVHQKRRSRAYQWKRPTIFLKEGDPIPPDIDPDTIRWIPANHPFATTTTDIDEGLAQNNVYQKHGVPFRIQAEHEALQRKLEALQNDQKFNNLVIDRGTAKDCARPFTSHPRSTDEKADDGSSTDDSKSSTFDPASN